MFAPAYTRISCRVSWRCELHAAFLDESRTRIRWWRPVQGIRGHGPKKTGAALPNAFAMWQKDCCQEQESLVHGVKAFEKSRPQPMYACANMGHPSREGGLPFVHRISNSDDFPKAMKGPAPNRHLFLSAPRLYHSKDP